MVYVCVCRRGVWCMCVYIGGVYGGCVCMRACFEF